MEARSKEYVAAKSRRYYHRHRDRALAKAEKYRQENYVAKKKVRSRVNKQEEMADRPRSWFCECCGEIGGKIVWDHSHETGKFRGWICGPCNWALGHVQDSTDVLRKMIQYLEETG
jgi:hypothetical protein